MVCILRTALKYSYTVVDSYYSRTYYFYTVLILAHVLINFTSFLMYTALEYMNHLNSTLKKCVNISILYYLYYIPAVLLLHFILYIELIILIMAPDK